MVAVDATVAHRHLWLLERQVRRPYWLVIRKLRRDQGRTLTGKLAHLDVLRMNGTGLCGAVNQVLTVGAEFLEDRDLAISI